MRLPVIASLVALVGCNPPPAEQSSWSGWRGAHQDGIAYSSGLSLTDESTLQLDWTAPLGAGYSGVSIAEGRVITMDSDGERDEIVALRATDGTPLWRSVVAATRGKEHPDATEGPLSTPLIHDGTVYGVGSAGELVSVDLDSGKKIWSMSMVEAFGAQAQQFGFATSPLIVDGVLVVMTGAGDGRTVVGLDPATAEVLWSHGSDPAGYQSPLVIELADGTQVVIATDRHVFGLDPTTGREIWKLAHIAEVHDGYAQVVFTGSDRFLVNYLPYSAGYRLISVDGRMQAEETWRSQELLRSLSAPVVHASKVYGFSRDTLAAFDSRTATRLWVADEDGRGLIRVDDLLVLWRSDGVLELLQPTHDGAVSLGQVDTGLVDSHSGPSFAGGRVFVRNHRGIAAVRVQSSAFSSSRPSAR